MAPETLLHQQPHHDGSPLYTADSTPALGDRVRVWVRVPAGFPVNRMFLRTCPDGDQMFAAAEVDTERTGRAVGGYGRGDTWWTVSVPVHNPVSRYRFWLDTPAGYVWFNASGLHRHDVTDNDDFRLVTHDPGPDWAARSVVYEIFPDRFARSAVAASLPLPTPEWAVACDWDTDPVLGDSDHAPYQLYGGDLDGIVEHLDHIQDLGADTVYLRPVFPAESNHRYNASTFDTVDPIVGGVPALGRLTDALHARGMRLIGDITTNHCGDTHQWFRTALADPSAPEREMFYFAPDGSYESWYDVATLPKLNWSSPLVGERMSAVVQRWLEFYDGWRVDVANMTGRFGAEDHNHDVARLLRATVRDTRPDRALIAEHMFDASHDLDDNGWNGTMNYAGFTRPVWTWLADDTAVDIDFLGIPGGVPQRDGVAALAGLRAFTAQTSWNATLHSWQLLDSFDCARIRSVVGTRERHLVAAGLQATLPGVPTICAGTEFGLTATFGEPGRIPMPWNRPAERDATTHDAYRALFGLRAAEPALQEGGLRWWHADAEALVFSREHAEGTVLVQARRSPGTPVTLPLDAGLTGLYGSGNLKPVSGNVTLPGDGPAVHVWRMAGA
jgi:alpha-glucosidase